MNRRTYHGTNGMTRMIVPTHDDTYERAHIDYNKPMIGYILDEDDNYPEGMY